MGKISSYKYNGMTWGGESVGQCGGEGVCLGCCQLQERPALHKQQLLLTSLAVALAVRKQSGKHLSCQPDIEE